MVRAAAVILLSAAFAQDGPPRVEPKAPAPGDRWVVKADAVLELDVTMADAGNQVPAGSIPKQLSLVRSDEFDQETLEASEKGRKDRIRVLSSKLQVSGTNISPRSEPTEIHGKAFVLTRSDKGKSLRLENGDPAPIGALGLGAWEEVSGLLPRGDAREGSSWTVDASAVADLIAVADVASGSGAFEVNLEKLAEGRATLAFAGVIEARTTRGAAMKLSITAGKLEFDAARGRPVSLEVSGSLEAAQDIFQRIPRPGEINPQDKVGACTVKSRKLEVKIEYRQP